MYRTVISLCLMLITLPICGWLHLLPLEPASPAITNRDWTPVIQTFNGVEMVQVPAGCFMMGTTETQLDAAFVDCEADRGVGNCVKDWFRDETPAHQVCFDQPFWIDRTEVTNAQFAALNGQSDQIGRWGKDERPRETITWFEARAYCESRGARLPTEAEWEYAARGPDGWIYPWGDKFVPENVVYGDTSGGETAPVGSRPGGVSWVGALDMIGNVWEWTEDYYGPYPAEAVTDPTGSTTGEYRVVRGGSWDYNWSFLRAAIRWAWTPETRYSIFGVRCAWTGL